MLASFGEEVVSNLIHRDASPNFQAQNGLSRANRPVVFGEKCRNGTTAIMSSARSTRTSRTTSSSPSSSPATSSSTGGVRSTSRRRCAALIATGYLRTARDLTHEDVGVIPQNFFGIVHDTLEIVGTGLLGLTVNWRDATTTSLIRSRRRTTIASRRSSRRLTTRTPGAGHPDRDQFQGPWIARCVAR